MLHISQRSIAPCSNRRTVQLTRMEQIGLLLDTHFLEADALRFSLMHRICSPYCIYNPSCYSFFSRPSISHPSQSSIPPCPICCTSRAVPVPKALALCPVHSRASLHIKYKHHPTFGKFTFGIITSFNALGASFFPLLGSPPGWY